MSRHATQEQPPTPISPDSAISPMTIKRSDKPKQPKPEIIPAILQSSPPPAGQQITLVVYPNSKISTSTGTRQRPKLTPIITRLRYPLMPLHPLPYGAPHPSFPPTVLHYHLLTEPQLDSIAKYYHQRPSGPHSPSRFWTTGYPSEMRWDDEFLTHVGMKRKEGEKESEGVERRVGIKRRKVGKFIGLRACETPAEEAAEYQRWKRIKEESRLKTDDLAFWGRRGWRT